MSTLERAFGTLRPSSAGMVAVRASAAGGREWSFDSERGAAVRAIKREVVRICSVGDGRITLMQMANLCMGWAGVVEKGRSPLDAAMDLAAEMCVAGILGRDREHTGTVYKLKRGLDSAERGGGRADRFDG